MGGARTHDWRGTNQSNTGIHTMKHLLLSAALIAATPLAAHATTDKPANCAVYAEELSKAVKADARVTGAAQSEAVETLDKMAAYMRKLTADSMEQTYEMSAAFGWDRAEVDRKFKEGEAAIRDGFHTATMDTDKVYTDHLLVINDCGKQMMRQGKLGQADVEKLGARMNAVYMAIR